MLKLRYVTSFQYHNHCSLQPEQIYGAVSVIVALYQYFLTWRFSCALGYTSISDC
ncbi:hypothetical protein NBRC10512v2_003058 [Rhodotorula toruloides]